jgi:hypothetical protein
VQVFAQPFMYWVGMDTDPRTTPEALAEFNRFYSTTHVNEVLAAHPGFAGVSRFELVDADAHRGPRWLAMYGARDEAAVLQYIKDNERPWLHRRKYSPWPPARRKAKTVWRMLWRETSVAPAAEAAPESIVLVGTNVPPQTDAVYASLELYRAFAHPEPGCPRFCAISPVDAPPDAIDATWRLTYRRISQPD